MWSWVRSPGGPPANISINSSLWNVAGVGAWSCLLRGHAGVTRWLPCCARRERVCEQYGINSRPMGHRDRTYVILDAGNDMWAYGYMKGWHASVHVDFTFADAHGLEPLSDRA